MRTQGKKKTKKSITVKGTTEEELDDEEIVLLTRKFKRKTKGANQGIHNLSFATEKWRFSDGQSL